MTQTIVHHRARSQRGVSLIDTLVAMSVMAIVGSMGTIQIASARRSMQGDGSMRSVMAQLRIARDMAITQRRNMEVRFVGANRIQIVRDDLPSGTTVLTDVLFEGNSQFSLVPGVADTPDGFGNASALSFGPSPAIMFGPSGALVGTNGVPVNGTVFLSVAGMADSVRAVTVLGATGDVHAFRWNGTTWTRV